MKLTPDIQNKIDKLFENAEEVNKFFTERGIFKHKAKQNKQRIYSVLDEYDKKFEDLKGHEFHNLEVLALSNNKNKTLMNFKKLSVDFINDKIKQDNENVFSDEYEEYLYNKHKYEFISSDLLDLIVIVEDLENLYPKLQVILYNNRVKIILKEYHINLTVHSKSKKNARFNSLFSAIELLINLINLYDENIKNISNKI